MAENSPKDLSSQLSFSFRFIQTEDGTIHSVLYSREDEAQMVNVKKAIVSAFQANFKGTREKQEADPQSLHTAKYRLGHVVC